ncbi:bifunctional (p)ppGpp synthetase/guanosine-3',5'-bis(diphosphate) 3'-pyrophosphohydrolase [Chloroflexi bacterium TSY]|nr:bifunctional (p)ppGpp synthetase/guanosine-3',5'-bis(diphosphate) 3'-pyrophosphohydrolase [Chloroflexi bacterium TSY]
MDTQSSEAEPEEKNGLDNREVDEAESRQPPGSAYVSLPNVSNKHIFAALRTLPVLSTVQHGEDEQINESESDIIRIAPEPDEQEALDKLFGLLPDLYSQNQLELILKAYVVASYAHRNQKRQSGEAYVLHPIEVTCILANLRMDADTLAAGLLHDVAEDTEFGIDYIETHFGQPVANMVDGVTKLKRINQLSNVRQGIADQKAESLRKMFLAMVDDVRVVLIKLADRLHNMRTLDGQKSHKRRRIARETLEIFAPLANRLGIWQIKWQLEDISFKYLDPETYRYLSKVMEQRQDEREKWVDKIQKVLKRELANQGISADVSGRPKHIYSIWRKMQRKGVDFDQIYDVHGFRVLVETEAQCYAALGVVHSMWRPIPGEFDDYIANPKDNMYRSLHTAVLSRANGRPMEVQIRTSEMHQIAEYGIAAHWRYKEQTRHNRQFEDKIAWLRQLMEWRQEVTDASEFVDSMKTDVFNDRVYVFTPQGEVVDLPTGSTPIDFAYSIHTELGHRCRGAKVDGKLVPLDYKLKNGEQVQVIASKRGGPIRDWLNPNLEYVATQRARSKIRSWLRKLDREDNIRQGKQVLDKETRRLAIHKSLEEIAAIFNYEDTDNFLAAVGYGDVNSQHIAQKLLEEERKEKEGDTQLNDIITFGPDQRYAGGQGIFVDGLEGMMTQMGRCCNPVPGDPIIGYVTRGRGVTIHRTSCANIAARYQRNQNNRLIEVQWTNNHQDGYPVNIQVSAYDRAGLLRDFSILVAEEKVNILFVEALTGQKNNLALINATLEIHDVAQLTRILTKIDRLPNVVESQRQV